MFICQYAAQFYRRTDWWRAPNKFNTKKIEPPRVTKQGVVLVGASRCCECQDRYAVFVRGCASENDMIVWTKAFSSVRACRYKQYRDQN